MNIIHDHTLTKENRLRLSLNDNRVFNQSLFYEKTITYEHCSWIQSIQTHMSKFLEPNMCHYLSKPVSTQLKKQHECH